MKKGISGLRRALHEAGRNRTSDTDDAVAFSATKDFSMSMPLTEVSFHPVYNDDDLAPRNDRVNSVVKFIVTFYNKKIHTIVVVEDRNGKKSKKMLSGNSFNLIAHKVHKYFSYEPKDNVLLKVLH